MMVTKHSGQRELFSEEKLTQSLRNSGFSPATIRPVLHEIQKQLYHDIPTRKIHQKVRKLLLNSGERVSKYCLKQAIHELVSLGCSFEMYVGCIFQALGYETHEKVVVKGTHIIHEIGVVAEKGDNHDIIECAFHHKQGAKNDLKFPLYSHAKFNDVEYSWRRKTGQRAKFQQGWVVTNTRFTNEAIHYSESVGMRVLGWDYPEDSGLKQLISSYGLHPVTSLSCLTKSDKKELLDHGIILCRALCDNPDLFNAFSFEYSKIRKVLSEGKDLSEASVTVCL